MDERETKIFEFLDRALNLVELWINRKYPEQKEEPNGEVWKRGEPLPEPKTPKEYEEFPRDQPGRFERAIQAARSARDADS